jgi:hypothetical protein
MKVKRFSEPTRYDAPNHRGFIGLRLQGFEPDGPKNQWVESHISSPAAARAPIPDPSRKFMSAWLAA